MASRKTCDKCAHYTPAPKGYSSIDSSSEHCGECALMGDSNEQNPRVDIDKAAGYDCESYAAGVYVGPKFGCIHWVRK